MKEKEEMMDMLFRYKETFSLRHEIGTCSDIEVGINMTDTISWFAKKVRKVIEKEKKCLCYLGTLKEGFSPYSSPIMLISQKVIQDRRVIIDFRHLNFGIAKNNLAYPLLGDTFSVLGNSRYEVLLVLDLKDAFHSLWLSEDSKRYCGMLLYFGSASYLYQRMPIVFNISPSIWQSYISAILGCLQSRKHCKAIMDDLLLFTHLKRAHMMKLEDLLKALFKNGLKISPKKCQLFKMELQYMGNIICIKDRKSWH